MSFYFVQYLELFILTLRRPSDAALWVMRQKVNAQAGWLALILVSILGTLLVQLSFALQPDEVRDIFAAALESPLRMALVQGVFLVCSVFALHIFGKIAGGQGRIEDALALMVWFQVTLIVLQIGQVVLTIVFPLAGEMASLLVFAVFFWILTHFTMALHGFKSVWLVLFGLLLALFGFAIVMVFVLVTLILPLIGA
ncbi:MAG: YIP1 family protein [Paracoccaceae bacterium]|jgi:hypothetical protein